ncbi:protein kinase [Nonomuraea sp. B1E8]|uniref:WD40 repeat domain-containing serine/threonine protein kinase n=1 Tax=unclassified Nonomuraea TaxID=2593643 RepID=UPI00325C6720
MPEIRPLRPDDPQHIGGYRLLGVLGTGGQGLVYRGAGDPGPDVAIKVLHSHLSHDGGATADFMREVEAARRVAAFCTAAVLDVGMLGDRPYIVSEYVPGDTLQAVVRSHGPRAGGALDRLAISTLTALTAIHQAGVVHRDFKPGNVLMGPDGPIVIDFGIAKALDASTHTSGLVGTPAYMSPEQFGTERVGPASDVFSWAGTIVFAATGRTPFAGTTVAAVVNSVINGVPDLSGVPGHLLPLIETCLSKDPASRPTPTDLLQDIIRRTNPGGGPHLTTPGPREGRSPIKAAPPSPGDSVPPPPRYGPAGVPGRGVADGRGRPPEVETAPHRTRPLSRRVVIGGVAAAAAAGVSAFAVLRPDRAFLDPSRTPLPPGSEHTNRPGQEVSSSASPRATGTGAGTPAPTPAASAEPFGTPVRGPVPLPSKSGDPVSMAASETTVVCATTTGRVLAWDVNAAGDGAAAVTALGDGGGTATSVAAGRVGDRPAVASGHADGRMRLWTLTGESLADHRAGDPVIAVTITRGGASGGRAIAVSQKYDLVKDLYSVVRLWDIATGKQIGPAISDHFQGVHGLAFGRLGTDDVLVTGDGRGRVRVWRLSTGKPRHSFGMGRYSGIQLLACGEIGGRPVVVSTHDNATLRVHDLMTGKRRKRWNFSGRSPDDRGTTALVAGRLGDLPIAAVTHAPVGGEVIVRIWDLDDGRVIGALRPADGGAVHALTLAQLDGRPVIAGAGEYGKAQVWSLGPA